jgi:hypothetical protein
LLNGAIDDKIVVSIFCDRSRDAVFAHATKVFPVWGVRIVMALAGIILFRESL